MLSGQIALPVFAYPGEYPFKFSRRPVVLQFPAGIPEVVQSLVVEGRKAYRFFKTMAGFLETPLGKIQNPQVVPYLGGTVVPDKGGMVAFFGKIEMFKLVVDQTHRNPGFGHVVVYDYGPVKAVQRFIVVPGALLGYTDRKSVV
jgi:hypothetical protein